MYASLWQVNIKLTAVVLACFFPMATTEVFSSSYKVRHMVEGEELILDQLKEYVDNQSRRLQDFYSFYKQRLRDVRSRAVDSLDLNHPNSVYRTIKNFVTSYSQALGDSFDSFQNLIQKSKEQFLADGADVEGARRSLLRLQTVYHLHAMDMARGNYLGYQGPQLQTPDAYEISQTAFTDGLLNESLDWLNVTLTLSTLTVERGQLEPSLGAIKALMGRVHIFNGNPHLAEALYHEAKRLDPSSGDVLMLEQELETQPRLEPPTPQVFFPNFSRLCRLDRGHHTPKAHSPILVCWFRPSGGLPYFSFKAELLSVSPYVVVIYDVITDKEGDHMKHIVKHKLRRGQVGAINHVESDVRVSDVAWIYSKDSPVTDAITERIELITGLNLSLEKRKQGPFSCEPFQIVNYGMGGYYDVHMDPFDSSDDAEHFVAGERIATFLIYLNDVEKGGSTVFPRIRLAVAPVKNMALLWYSFTPDLQRDDLTYHAGCPVLIGQKWITNKWIWTYGNTFRRRCGLRPDATQLDIEPDMNRGYL